MKKMSLVLASSLVLLASCGQTEEINVIAPAKPPVVATGATESGATTATGTITAGPLMSVDYTLTVDGKVVETSLEAKAKELGLYQTGTTYKPLEFVIGQGGMIKGFEDAVRDMKAGEKKSFSVSPENGYGTGAGAPTIETVQKAQVAPAFEITQDAARLGDTVTETIALEQLGKDGSGITVGKVINGANGATAKVISINGTGVTLDIDNVINPFYKKDRKVGATAEQAPYTYTIKSMNDKEIVLSVTNSSSPFAGKEFKVGAEAENAQGRVKILEINGEEIKIEFQGPAHPMAGKTLNFEVEVKDVR